MYLMYVDESGDTGIKGSPTKYFILTGIVFHELKWRTILSSLVEFRRHLRDTKGLKIREEIHAKDFVNKPGKLVRIKKNDRVDILKKCIHWLNEQEEVSVFSIVVDKTKAKGDVFDFAWNTLLNRFENTIAKKNFNGACNNSDKGIIIPDNTDAKRLTGLLRRMRHYNPVPSMYGTAPRNLKLQCIIEDPVYRDSSRSLMHQIADVTAYIIRQKYEPNAYMKKKSGHTLYMKLDKVALQKATSKNKYGLVEV